MKAHLTNISLEDFSIGRLIRLQRASAQREKYLRMVVGATKTNEKDVMLVKRSETPLILL